MNVLSLQINYFQALNGGFFNFSAFVPMLGNCSTSKIFVVQAVSWILEFVLLQLPSVTSSKFQTSLECELGVPMITSSSKQSLSFRTVIMNKGLSNSY